jgi:uncharacterized RDD family membrane protein YckC
VNEQPIPGSPFGPLSPFEFSGLLPRVAAGVLDATVLLVVILALGAAQLAVPTGSPLGQIVGLGWLAASLAYLPVQWAIAGRTIGMRPGGLRIVREADGGKIGWATTFVRFLAWIVAGLAFGLGFAWIAFDPRKRGWHDRIAGTVVIHRLPPDRELISAMTQLERDTSDSSLQRYYAAVIGSSLLMALGPDERGHEVLVTATDDAGRATLPAFTDRRRLMVWRPGSHVYGPHTGPSVCDLALELGLSGVDINPGSEPSRLVNHWQAGWVAAGLMPTLRKPDEPEINELARYLNGLTGGPVIDAAYLAWSRDPADRVWLAFVVVPAGRWPRQTRRDLARAVTHFSHQRVEGATLRLVALTEPPDSSTLDGMLRIR